MFQSYAKYMERRFFYSGLDFEGKFPNGKRKLDVLFKDRHGNILGRWTPRWDEVQLICAVLSVVEKQNNPDTQ